MPAGATPDSEVCPETRLNDQSLPVGVIHVHPCTLFTSETSRRITAVEPFMAAGTGSQQLVNQGPGMYRVPHGMNNSLLGTGKIRANCCTTRQNGVLTSEIPEKFDVCRGTS